MCQKKSNITHILQQKTTAIWPTKPSSDDDYGFGGQSIITTNPKCTSNILQYNS